MGRLIDSDDVVNIFTNRLFETLKTQIPVITATESNICLETCYKIAKYEIDNIPTAYNVDAVVSEIHKKHCQKCRNILSVANAEEYCKSQKCRIDDICDIVKRGGVE